MSLVARIPAKTLGTWVVLAFIWMGRDEKDDCMNAKADAGMALYDWDWMG